MYSTVSYAPLYVDKQVVVIGSNGMALRGAQGLVNAPVDSTTFVMPLLQTSLAFRLVFSTQTNVQYTDESASSLPNPSPNWTQKIRIDGDGKTATITMPAQPTIEFFRVKAERKP